MMLIIIHHANDEDLSFDPAKQIVESMSNYNIFGKLYSFVILVGDL